MNYKPQIFTDQQLAPKNAVLVEAFDNSVAELFYIRHPQWKKNQPGASEALAKFKQTTTVGEIWVWYEWCQTLVHTVEEAVYYELLTARNKNAISSVEQAHYRGLHIGIIGLSIGSGVVNALAITGGPKHQKIADFDHVEISNLNRMKATLLDIGQPKLEVTARNLWAIDPFLDLELWGEGVNSETLEQFILDPRLDVFIDEMDSLDLKIQAREICKRERIPVIMATDNGDGILLDIERFDLEPNRPIFHGLIGELTASELKNIDYKQWLSVASKIVGAEYLTERMQESLLDIGKTLAGVPQLGTTAGVAASGVSVALRILADKRELVSGRYSLGFEQLLIPGYNEEKAIAQRKQKTEEFKQKFGR